MPCEINSEFRIPNFGLVKIKPMKINCFEDLEIWQSARELCKRVRDLTVKEPFARDFRLKDQIRASSGSVMDNIAEGFERDGRKEFIQHLSISKGSCGETRSQSYRAFDYDYITEAELGHMVETTESLGKRIGGFMNYLKRSDYKGNKYK